ncbi:hypothetical protein [Butyrivibrio sp. INlla16]|uniref:hypothetical protein n=1 Tax=Butyrivibrio sp. INlla16 TaxID=1520807 RepID=UPI000884F616|nr:hypothetical protein [Butyrivibrio sp. INlla16]SDB54066.1 hypothetical protein SAMN02910263_02738 [Butyrivibrio sp. INlla16]
MFTKTIVRIYGSIDVGADTFNRIITGILEQNRRKGKETLFTKEVGFVKGGTYGYIWIVFK